MSVVDTYGVAETVMPKWGVAMETGKVTEWLVSIGDEVKDGQEIAEVETDKIAGVLESATTGVVRALIAEVGEAVPVGAVVALIASGEVPQSEIDEAAARARAVAAAGPGQASEGPAVAEVAVGGRTISYTSSGAGERLPVVLVHGFGGDKGTWGYLQEALATGRQVLAPDLPGHGASTKDVGDGSVGELGRVLAGFVDALGLPQVHLVGHSLGGAVVTWVAGDPATAERVASVTLLAPAGFGPSVNADYLRGFAAAETRRELKPHLEALFADPAFASRDFVDSTLGFTRLDGAAAALGRIVDAILAGDESAIDVSEAYARMRAASVAVWGSADLIIPPENARRLDSRTSLHVLDDVGHMSYVERPQAVLDAIRSAIGDR